LLIFGKLVIEAGIQNAKWLLLHLLWTFWALFGMWETKRGLEISVFIWRLPSQWYLLMFLYQATKQIRLSTLPWETLQFWKFLESIFTS
jgi:hypothetical protein